MATTYLNKTLSGSATDNNKWTWSAWIKRTGLGSEQILFYADDGGSNYYTNLRFNDQDEINFQNRFANSNDMYLITTEKYRDTNAWYHIVAVLDTSNSTAADRQIIYVNGTRLSNYRTETTSTLNKGSTINDGYEHRIGRGNNVHGSDYFDGIMSHVHFSDGYVYDASTFGETDSTTGEWKIKTSPSITMGTNGFTILKDGNTVTDQSSNSNNFTVGAGTLTNTEDCPSNVFATLNGVGVRAGNFTLANGNTTGSYGSADWETLEGSLGINKGKWYYETKWNGTGAYMAGWTSTNFMSGVPTNYVGHTITEPSYALQAGDGGVYYSTSSAATQDSSGWGDSFTSSDILGCAIDIDNGKIYWSKNGVWMNSGDPTSGSTGTGAFSISDTATNYFWQPVMSCYNGGQGIFNFGNGFFGTTAISSEGTNASGIGKFEYDVPAGYTALSTKGLNE